MSGWRPQYESDSLEQGTENNATNTSSNDAIHILCDGITCFDKEHMGAISFYPGPFFKDYYFPVDNSHDYRSPLIGLQFENLHRKSIYYILFNRFSKLDMTGCEISSTFF